MAPRETENNAYAKFWRDKQRTLWYVMVFLEWSILGASVLLGPSFQKTKNCRKSNSFKIRKVDLSGLIN